MKIAFLNWLRRLAGKSAHGQAVPLSSIRHQVYVHPCVINNQPHIVYPRGLQDQAPQLFQQLHNHFRDQGYALKEDQRSGDAEQQPHPERRRWAPILLFTTGLIFESAAFAETENETHDTTAHAQQTVELRLVASNASTNPVNELRVSLPPPKQTEPAPANAGVAGRIYAMLTQHYQKHDTDPDYILNDFKEVANYYSGFPEVIDILDSLNNKKWQLVYDERSWSTAASGNVFHVDNASVHFNTRSAAQLKFNNRCKENPVCVASPADALLHELLHTHSMLVNTKEFIAQGGMSAVLYPYKHEYAIIEAERKLYASMSRRDDIKRPQRIDHTGRLVVAQCPTCIK
jgi:hypothetical protein